MRWCYQIEKFDGGYQVSAWIDGRSDWGIARHRWQWKAMKEARRDHLHKNPMYLNEVFERLR